MGKNRRLEVLGSFQWLNSLFFRRGNQPIFEEPDYSSEDHSEIQDDYEYDLDHFYFDDEKPLTTTSTTTSTTTEECDEYHGCANAKSGDQIVDFFNGMITFFNKRF